VTTYYFDTSAIVKGYVPEAGSEWTLSLLEETDATGAPAHVVALSEIGIVEVSAAVARRERSGHLAPPLAAALLSSFLRDCDERFLTLGVRSDIVRRASRAARRHALRAYDAVHLASALVLEEQLRAAGLETHTFVSADRQLLSAATREGLAALDPAEQAT